MGRVAAVVVLAALAFSAVGCGGDGAAVRGISPDAAVDLVRERGGDETFTVIDVRSPDEFAAGHLEGAVNIDVQEPAFADLVAELPRDHEYLLYCRTGNRSATASAVMEDLGFERIRNVTGGGFDELAAAGAEVAER